MAAVVSLPAAVQRGLSVNVLATSLRAAPAGEGAGVWVPRDSALKTPRDLKGKTLGSYGLRSTGYTQIRIALAKKYGPAVIEDAAKAALELGVPSYRFLRRYLERRPPVPLTLKQVDPLIRQLTLYRDLIDRTGDAQ